MHKASSKSLVQGQSSNCSFLLSHCKRVRVTWRMIFFFFFVYLFVCLIDFVFLICVYLFFCQFLWLLPKLFQIGWNKKRDLDILVSQWFGLLRNAHKIRHRLVRAWRTWNIFWSSLTEKKKKYQYMFENQYTVSLFIFSVSIFF